jgi:hypothetical protein
MEQQDILDPDILQKKKKRPTAILVMCILNIIGALFVVPLVFSNTALRIGTWYPAFLGASTIVGLLCTIGYWKMKKWAVYTYASLFIVGQIIMILTGIWTISSVIFPAIFLLILMNYFNLMD